ncbi:hypothetical protein ACFV2U_37490 [Streptomyces sp. NPDC059697]
MRARLVSAFRITMSARLTGLEREIPARVDLTRICGGCSVQ